MIPGMTDGIRMLHAITMTLCGERALKTSRPFSGHAGLPAGIFRAAFPGTKRFKGVVATVQSSWEFDPSLLEFRADSSRNLGPAVVLHYRRANPPRNRETMRANATTFLVFVAAVSFARPVPGEA